MPAHSVCDKFTPSRELLRQPAPAPDPNLARSVFGNDMKLNASFVALASLLAMALSFIAAAQ
ncbi:MAG: hypothetical protein ABIP49_09490, partial [Lysobacterales bacterium]